MEGFHSDSHSASALASDFLSCFLQVPLERWRAMSRSCFTAPSVGASAVDYCAVTAAKAKAAALAASGGGGDQGAGAAAGGAAGGAGGKRGRKAAAAATAAAAVADDLPAVGAALASALLANKETIAPPCVSLDPRNGYVAVERETKTMKMRPQFLR